MIRYGVHGNCYNDLVLAESMEELIEKFKKLIGIYVNMKRQNND